ncbi:MAG TPA: hypothetical protein VFB20_16730, partial [Burkholderiales bacterium]|nr:hypothetical protein [Burkholderiales bacterium]
MPDGGPGREVLDFEGSRLAGGAGSLERNALRPKLPVTAEITGANEETSVTNERFAIRLLGNEYGLQHHAKRAAKFSQSSPSALEGTAVLAKLLAGLVGHAILHAKRVDRPVRR